MNEFFRFVASPAGRGIRIAAGLALAGTSLANPKKPNWPLLGVSLIPLSAGLFDWCFMAPLDGKPFEGEPLRKLLGD